MRLPPIAVGLGASLFTTAPSPVTYPAGDARYYADAKVQIAALISLASHYVGAATDIAPIANAVSALASDVNGFNAADKAAVTSSILWTQLLADAPTANQVTIGIYPTAAAQSLALDATTIQSTIALMPSVTTASVAAANAAAAAERYAQIKTAARGNVAVGPTVPVNPVTVIVQAPAAAAPSALAQLPWNFIIGGALVVGAVLFILEEKKR
jgi:hypothetical protein